MRVQTMPDALATSIAATRSRICSCSSTSTCWPAGTARPPPITGRRRAARGLGWDTETLTGVLVATVRDPAVGPRRQTQARPPTAKDTSASAGSPTHFHASTASHKGHFDSGVDGHLPLPWRGPAIALRRLHDVVDRALVTVWLGCGSGRQEDMSARWY